MNEIYDSNSARLLLGVLLIKPQIINDDKYPLKADDFECSLFHKRLYQAISSLAKHGAKTIECIDLDSLANKNNSVKELFEENNLKDFIDTITQLAKIENVDLYYDNVRKCSLLRNYAKFGFDISKFKNDIEKIQIKDIVDYYEGIQAKINQEFYRDKNREEYIAGKDFLETKEKMKESPTYGASFQSPYLNSIFRGAYGFILRAGKSGSGKTIFSLGDLCKMTCTEYFDISKNEFVVNKSRVGAGLFINTEMDLRTEIDPIIISWISGVKRDHILDGFYQGNEEQRVEYATKILQESKLYIIDDPYFTTRSLVNAIKEYSTLYQVKNVCFDYIQNNGYVASEIANMTKIPQREDMVLLALTDRLKQIQRQCGIGLISAVQTNGQEDSMNFPTESCLAGSKAQVRKTDGTMVILPPKKSEIEIFDMIKSSSMKIPDDAICNNITHIIKGRSSKYPKYIKIFQYVDYGTSRCYDWCVTDKDGALINIDKMLIEYDGRKII